MRQGIDGEFGAYRLALWHQAIKIEATAGQHIRQHFQRRGVRAVQSRHAEGDHGSAFGAVRIHGKRGRNHWLQVDRLARRQRLARY